MAAYPALDSALTGTGATIDRARQNLYYCDVGFLQKGTRQLRHDVHAATYVYVAAAMESYMAVMLTGVTDEINARGLPLQDLRLSLFAMVQGSNLEALQAVRGLKMWTRRSLLFQNVNAPTACYLDSAHLPTDGGTIRPAHIETAWSVLGINGLPMPSPRHGLALTDLADSRNSIAHGADDGTTLAGRKTIEDTLRLLDRIEELVLHIHYSLVDYLDQRGYER